MNTQVRITIPRTYAQKLIIASVAFVACAFMSLPAQASTITWGTATNTTGASNVSLNGTLVAGFNGGASDTTVLGVLFGSADLLPGAGIGAGLLAGADTGDAAFNVLLDQVDFGGGNALTTVDLGSFTSGNTYEVQVFFTDQRPASNTRVMTFGSSDTAGVGASTVNLAGDPDQTAASPFGQFAIGTFTANGNDPDLTLTPNGFGNSHFSAIQIRNLTAIPEPSMLAILSFGVVGLIGRRRRN